MTRLARIRGPAGRASRGRAKARVAQHAVIPDRADWWEDAGAAALRVGRTGVLRRGDQGVGVRGNGVAQRRAQTGANFPRSRSGGALPPTPDNPVLWIRRPDSLRCACRGSRDSGCGVFSTVRKPPSVQANPNHLNLSGRHVDRSHQTSDRYGKTRSDFVSELPVRYG